MFRLTRKDFEILSEGRADEQGSQIATLTFQYSQTQGEVKTCRQTEIVWVVDNHVYLLNFVAEGGLHDRLRETFDRIRVTMTFGRIEKIRR